MIFCSPSVRITPFRGTRRAPPDCVNIKSPRVSERNPALGVPVIGKSTNGPEEVLVIGGNITVVVAVPVSGGVGVTGVVGLDGEDGSVGVLPPGVGVMGGGVGSAGGIGGGVTRVVAEAM